MDTGVKNCTLPVDNVMANVYRALVCWFILTISTKNS